MESLEGLAYDAALRSLDKQERTLEELRARTGLLLAASSLAASFLGRAAFDSGSPLLVAPALCAFVHSVSACAYVLLPKRTLLFAVAGGVSYEGLYEFRDDIVEVERRLAYYLDRYWVLNDAVITRLLAWFRVAAFALILEIVLLLVAASDTLL